MNLSPDELVIISRALAIDLSLTYLHHDTMTNENNHTQAAELQREIDLTERLLKRINRKIERQQKASHDERS